MKRIALLFATFLLASCQQKNTDSTKYACVDLDSIRSRGSLRVVTDYNTINYFVHKDIAVGYQYELMNEYCQHAGLKLDLAVCNDNEKNVADLRSGRIDLVVTTLIADTASEKRMAFTEPYGESQQVLVQLKKNRRATLDELSGDTISVLANSFYARTLQQHNDTSRSTPIIIDQIENYDAEQILQLVAEQEVARTLCLETIVRANKWYYPNLDFSVGVGPKYDLAWGVRPNSELLISDINSWLRDFKKTSKFKTIFRKYIIDPREHHSNVQSTSADTYRNDYEDIIRAHATDSRFDWLMVSAIIYQESHFNPEARSWAGACGLMQLMPETAKRFGVQDPTIPEQNIEAGVRFLAWLDKRLVDFVPNDQERIMFTLAAYNVGLGHVMDAIRLARVLGLKTNVWFGNVEVALLHKANPTYYSNTAVKHGYCRGSETINYVRAIVDRYKNYKAEYGLTD